MTAPIVQRLRETAAALSEERVSTQTLAHAHGTAAHGTLLLLMAGPCLLPVPGVGTVLGFGIAALAAAMWTAAAIGLMAFIVILPIPFGNLLPALAMMLIGLGLVFRDGVVAVLGMITAVLAVFVTAGLVLMAWVYGSEWILRWASS